MIRRSLPQVPILRRPAYCDDEDVLALIRTEATRPLQYDMHPCNFLLQPPTLPAWDSQLWVLLDGIRHQRRLTPDAPWGASRMTTASTANQLYSQQLELVAALY
jgi:hypothetical protein